MIKHWMKFLVNENFDRNDAERIGFVILGLDLVLFKKIRDQMGGH